MKKRRGNPQWYMRAAGQGGFTVRLNAQSQGKASGSIPAKVLTFGNVYGPARELKDMSEKEKRAIEKQYGCPILASVND